MSRCTPEMGMVLAPVAGSICRNITYDVACGAVAGWLDDDVSGPMPTQSLPFHGGGLSEGPKLIRALVAESG